MNTPDTTAIGKSVDLVKDKGNTIWINVVFTTINLNNKADYLNSGLTHGEISFRFAVQLIL